MRYAYCAWDRVAVVSDAYRCFRRCRPRVSSDKTKLNICQGTIDDAVGLFQNIANATLIILENNSTMSCKKHIILRDIRLHSPKLLLY